MVHALWHGFALCGFSGRVPYYWPEGHFWVGPDDTENITCASCKTEAKKLIGERKKETVAIPDRSLIHGKHPNQNVDIGE